jgi:DNA-binding Xre family transcriptional regulator
MTKTMTIRWQLRLRMAEKGLFKTSQLQPLLAERGIHLSREQVYRLVTHDPQRLSMDVLAALCDILQVTPNDLIEVVAAPRQLRKTGTGPAAASGQPGPSRTVIRRPQGS